MVFAARSLATHAPHSSLQSTPVASELNIGLTYKNRPAFDAETDFQFSIKNATNGVLVKEFPSSQNPEKYAAELIYTADDKDNLPDREIAFALDSFSEKQKNGVWPPQFAVLKRSEGVSTDTLKALNAFPAHLIKQAGEDTIIDLSNDGYKAYHGQGDTQVMAPIMTAKVARGDTLMVQYGLEREGRKGDILFIDSGETYDKSDTPKYANVGDMLRATAIKQGFTGLVSNGFIRDSSAYQLKPSEPFFAAYAKGITPNGPTKLEAGAINLPLKTKGHTINSNDIFVAKENDIFVIPAAKADALLQSLKEKMGDEVPHDDSARQGAGTPLSSEGVFKSTQNILKNLASRLEQAIPSKHPLRDTPVTDEVLAMMKRVPTAEYADSYSTLTPARTTGIGLPLSAGDEENSAGVALLVDGTQKSLKKGISQAKQDNTVIIRANQADDIVLNDALLKRADDKNIAAIVTNGTAVLNSTFKTPVYASRLLKGEEPLKTGKGEGVLAQPISLEGVNIHPGDIIVGDKDGIVAIPQGLEEFGMRGGHSIAAKEHNTLEKIKSGKVTKRELPQPLYPSSDLANADFLQRHIEGRDAPVQTARGSSGLVIPQPEGIKTAVQEDIAQEGMRPFEVRAEGEALQGTPIAVAFHNAEPAVFTLKTGKENRLGLGESKTIAVQGIQGANFLRAMHAKAKQQPITIEANGDVHRGLKKV